MPAPAPVPVQSPVQQAPTHSDGPPDPIEVPAPTQGTAPTQATGGVRNLQGIDVSHWQGNIDWHAANADGIDVAYIKASESTNFVDNMYARNRSEAIAAGVQVGAYHFARPGRDGGSVEADARAEAAHFLDTAQLQPGNLVPALDLEASNNLSKAELARWTRTWLDTVSANIGGRAPLVYVSPSYWNSKVADTLGIARDYPLWVAHWGVNAPDTPGNWDAWAGWQRTSDGSVDGIKGRVDRDTFRVGQPLTSNDVG